MSFVAEFNRLPLPSLVERSLDTTASKVESVLSKPVRTLHEFASLISPAAESRLEELSRHAHALTVQRTAATRGNGAELFVDVRNEFFDDQCFAGNRTVR